MRPKKSAASRLNSTDIVAYYYSQPIVQRKAAALFCRGNSVHLERQIDKLDSKLHYLGRIAMCHQPPRAAVLVGGERGGIGRGPCGLSECDCDGFMSSMSTASSLGRS